VYFKIIRFVLLSLPIRMKSSTTNAESVALVHSLSLSASLLSPITSCWVSMYMDVADFRNQLSLCTRIKLFLKHNHGISFF
jgi:hypothetical protein